MKNKAIGLLAVVFLIYFVLPASSLFGADERILSFHSGIAVHRDASMTVTETIKVRSEGDKIKHGIYRDFPTRYKDMSGKRYVVGFTVSSALRDGRPEPYRTEKISNGMRTYLGDKDVLLPAGEYTYTLVYQTDRQLGYFKDFDELYWNVTGNGWEFPIDNASAIVELPGGASEHIISTDAYTGPSGSKGKEFEKSRDPSGNLLFATTRSLGEREGLTIAVSWPKGYVTEPDRAKRMQYFYSDYSGVIKGVIGLAVMLFYYLVVWARVGKDPEPGTIVPLYTPPRSMSPAVMRYIAKMEYDGKCFASALINLAVKGAISIRENEGKYTLRKEEGGKSPLSPEEEKIRSALLGQDSEITLEKTNHAKIREAISSLTSYLKLKYEKIYFVTNIWYFVAGLAISVIILFLCGFTEATQKGSLPVFFFMCLWLSGWSLGVTFLLLQVIASWKAVIRGHGGGPVSFVAAGFITMFSLPFLAGEVFGIFALSAATTFFMAPLLLLTVFINYLFYHLLKAPTRAGRNLLDSVEGFRMYLSATESDRLNMLTPPEKTPELFERYLPYALALDLEQRWAEQFSGVLAASAAEGRGAGYAPAWYSGAAFSAMHAGDFASSLGGSFSEAIASSSTAPGSSSGSGGGGSSGGGGGGGGGGGW